MTPTGTLPSPPADPEPRRAETAMMPRRTATRAANRSHRITTERARNQHARTGIKPTGNPRPDVEDPPF
jgi:hypothetical protein